MTAVPTGTRALALQRDGHRCARCGQSVLNAPGSLHHRKPRGMGGSGDPRVSDPRNLVLLCGTGTTGCHGWVESHRELSYASGWLLRSLDDLNEPLIPLWGDAFALTVDGERVAA